jgi:adenylate cyclase
MSISRQLAAILFADIQGYTALMQVDEAKANSFREKLKKNLDHEALLHNGRILKLSGDGALCIFNSAIEAVRAAIGIQKAMLLEPVVPLRIGIHTGDVMFEEGDVYGDGVNIASRIESFAVAGSVFISGKVFDEIKNQKDIQTVSLGKFALKNVSIPVEIFAVANDQLVVPKKETITGKGIRAPGKIADVKKLFIASAAVLMVLAVFVFLYKKYSPADSGDAQLKSIAVIPFTNMSAQKDDEYFTDGVCNEIQTQLSKIGALNVISRTTMLQFRDTKKAMKEIGEETGADVLLEGSVQKSNDRVHITVQLIDAKHDKQLWADTYDKDFKDIFSIQSDVAKSIAMQLKAKLTSSEKALIEKRPTTNMEAYNLYLKGNFEIAKVTPEGLTNGLAMLNKAIKLDPQFTLPYIGIAYYYGLATDFYMSPNEAMPQLKIAAQTAVAMDSMLADAHDLLGMYELWYAWEWEKAQTELLKAIDLKPNGYLGHFFYSWYLVRAGRFDEAKREGARMVELEPMAGEENSFNAMLYYYARQYDEALRLLDKAGQIDPNYPFTYFLRGQCYIQQKKFTEAIAQQKRSHDLFAAPWSHARVAYAYACAGKTQEAISILDSLKKQSGSVYVASDVVASVYVALGDKEHAFEYLEKAFNERAGWMLWIKVDPIWDPIRSDARFIAIVNKMGLE